MNKKFTITLVLAGVMVALMGYIFLFEKEKMEEENPKKDIVKTDILGELKKVDFSPQMEEPFSIEKTSNLGWIVSKPHKYRANRTSVESFEENLAKLVTEDLVEEKAKDLSKYGLDTPSMKINLQYKNGNKLISIGEQSFDGQFNYVMMDDSNDVYYVSVSLIEPITISYGDIQDKHIVDINANKIEEIGIKKDGKDELNLKKDENGVWSFLTLNETINQEAVTGFINQIANIEADSILSADESKDLVFSESKNIINLKTDKSNMKILSISEEKDDTNFLIKVELDETLNESPEGVVEQADDVLKPWDFIFRISKNKFEPVYKEGVDFILKEENTEGVEANSENL